MSVKFPEEFKEALLKTKGQEAFVLVHIKDGRWTFVPTLFTETKKDGKYVTLKEFKPLKESKKIKDALIADIIPEIKETLQKDIETAVEKALSEKSIKQLEEIRKASGKGAKLEHKRGCFWLVTKTEEVCL